MSDTDGPYPFDVGEIDAVVPYPAVIGAHNVLTAYYGRSNAEASRLLQNFLDAERIHWYDEITKTSFGTDWLGRAMPTSAGGMGIAWR